MGGKSGLFTGRRWVLSPVFELRALYVLVVVGGLGVGRNNQACRSLALLVVGSGGLGEQPVRPRGLECEGRVQPSRWAWQDRAVLGATGGGSLLLVPFPEARACSFVICSQGAFVWELGQPVSEAWKAWLCYTGVGEERGEKGGVRGLGKASEGLRRQNTWEV